MAVQAAVLAGDVIAGFEVVGFGGCQSIREAAGVADELAAVARESVRCLSSKF